VFGVRGLYLKKCPARVFSVTSKLFHLESTKWVDTGFRVDYRFIVRSEQTVGDMIETLNYTLELAWDGFNKNLSEGVINHGFEWRQNRNTGNVELVWSKGDTTRPDGYLWQYSNTNSDDCSFDRNLGPTFLLDVHDRVDTSVSMTLDSGQVILQEVELSKCCCCGQPTGGSTPTPAPEHNDEVQAVTGVLGNPYIQMWDREDVLIRASFVQQTQNQHLGYTGVDYNTPKKFQIIHNSPIFTISLWSQSTLPPVELPSDNRDYVVMECVVYRDYNV
jgi:hypothetical protein